MTPLGDAAIDRLQRAASWPEFLDDRYAVRREIGRGGMGTVYQVRDEAFGRDVAVKVSNAVGVAALEARIRTEAGVVAGLEHPGIVPIHDVGRLADGRVFYVMKFVRGKMLLDHLGAEASLNERLRIFERVCEPVAFAHAHGVVHRDLKPANVMVGPFGEVLVMDWGIAKLLARPAPDEIPTAGAEPAAPAGAGLTEPGTVVGTPGYMAPEQAQSDPGRIDHRADVFGLGAVLFTMLTGEAPPADPDRVAPRLREYRPAIPRALRSICEAAMAPRPEARYQAVTALSDDIAAFRAGDPITACPESWYERAWRVASRYRAAILLLLAYLVMRTVIAVALGR